MSSRKEAITNESIQEQQDRSIEASQNWLFDRRSFLMAGCVSLGMSGCNKWVARGQNSPLDPKELIDNPNTPYISSMTNVWGGEPAKIEGVGLVSELKGTGSAPSPSRFRDELETELKKRDVDDAAELMAENWTSLALLGGIIPAGARAGQKYDVFVSLPVGSETTSLESGYLMPASMSSRKIISGKALGGRDAGKCEGQILINQIFQSNPKPNSKLAGVVPGGGKLIRRRFFGLRLKTDIRSVKSSVRIARAINQRFTFFKDSKKSFVANAKNDREIGLETPEIYRDNVYRYLHVLRNITINENPKAKADRRQALEADLVNPATAELAALRLEAIGKESLGALTRGLAHQSPVVQFASAMAVAYLGDDSSSETLARLAVENPTYRWHALTALNAVAGPKATIELKKLLHSDEIETRYAATRSLVLSGQTGEEISSSPLGGRGKGFTLRTVFSNSKPYVHVARYKEPEIVIYNGNIKFYQNSRLAIKGWTIKGVSADEVEIINYRTGGNDLRIRCSSYVEAVARTLANNGVSYSSLIELLRQAGQDKAISGEVVVSALANPNRLKDPTAVSGVFHNEQDALAGLESKKPDRRAATDQAIQRAAKKPTFFQRLRKGFR